MNTVLRTLRPPLPLQLDYRQAARYLGVHTPDEATQALLEKCAPALLAAAQPRGVWVCLPVEQLASWPLGNDLKIHLQGCHSALLLALTLGAGVDALLRRLSFSDMAAGSAADALASTLIEQCADAMEQTLRRELEGENTYLTGRFSPGYGDSPLTLQPMLCQLLDTQRKIGLTAGETLLLSPRKSVTALLGVADHPVSGKLAGCGHCRLKETCQYRKRGTTCASE